jgi:ethanolamine utilization protein EutQ (cupin superfamily)
MKVRKLTRTDARFERSPGQDGEIYSGNLVDQRDGGPVTIGYGRWLPHQRLKVELVVHDTMIVLEGEVWADTPDGTLHAGPGDIVYMPEGETVTIRTGECETITAYVTYPHWQVAEGGA